MNIGPEHLSIYVLTSAASFVCWIGSASFILWKAGDRVEVRRFATVALLGGTYTLFPFLASLAPDDRSALFNAKLAHLAAPLIAPTFLHLALTITGTVAHSLLRRILIATYLVAVGFVLLIPSPLFFDQVVRFAPHFAVVPGPFYHLFVIFWAASTAVGFAVLFTHRRTAEPRKRNQLTYIILFFLIGFVQAIVHFISVYFGAEPFPHDLLGLICPIALAHALVRHQLMDIRIVVSKGLVYSLLIAAITATYLVMVMFVEHWFQGFMGYQSIVATAVVGFIIAVGFNPLRGQVQSFIDRLLFQGTPLELAAQRERLLVQVTHGEQMKAVATLAAGLAHEIKNPLAAMKTFVEYLPEKHQDPEFIERFSRVVGQEVAKMNDLVQRLLEFAKPSAPAFRTVDPYILIRETLDFLQESLMRKQIKVTVSSQAGTSLQTDPIQLRQVLLNILLNSIEAMERPGEIWIALSDAEGQKTISIKDNGPGISEQHLAHIFDPFFTTKPGGTGLGLAVAQSIIREHGGEVKVSSEIGKGTIVTLLFPRGHSPVS